MERTMMESFCAAANFRGFLKRLDLPSIITEIAEAMGFSDEVRGTLPQSAHSDFGKTSSVKISREERNRENPSKLDDDIIEALGKASTRISTFIGRNWVATPKAVTHDRVVIAGKTFSVEKTTTSVGLICIRNGDYYVPARLRTILSVTYPDAANEQMLNVLFLFVVHQHLPVLKNVSDPFLKYPEFGGRLVVKGILQPS